MPSICFIQTLTPCLDSDADSRNAVFRLGALCLRSRRILRCSFSFAYTTLFCFIRGSKSPMILQRILRVSATATFFKWKIPSRFRGALDQSECCSQNGCDPRCCAGACVPGCQMSANAFANKNGSNSPFDFCVQANKLPSQTLCHRRRNPNWTTSWWK